MSMAVLVKKLNTPGELCFQASCKRKLMASRSSLGDCRETQTARGKKRKRPFATGLLA